MCLFESVEFVTLTMLCENKLWDVYYELAFACVVMVPIFMNNTLHVYIPLLLNHICISHSSLSMASGMVSTVEHVSSESTRHTIRYSYHLIVAILKVLKWYVFFALKYAAFLCYI